MRYRPTAVLSFALAAASPAWGQPAPAPSAGGEQGFFRPAADPAITAIRPAPPQAPPERPLPLEQAVAREVVEQMRRAAQVEELERAEREHEREKAEAARAASAPVAIASPLDGTAPIASPLDGTAPILSPIGR